MSHDWQKRWEGKRGADSPVKLIGLRGALQPAGNGNAVGLYDDLVIVMIGDQVTAWRASLDPSPALIKSPVSPDGAAQLMPGVHFMRKHLLHANPVYRCLIQAETVRVQRLGKDGSPREVQSGWFGIAIHSGGAGDDTKKFSAGCTIIHNPDGYHANPTWSRFIGPIWQAMGANKLTTVPYLVDDASGFGTPVPLSNA